MTMRAADLDRVRALPLFSRASPEVFRDVTAGAFLQRFPAGTSLLMEGDTVDFLYVLLDGAVELQGPGKRRRRPWHCCDRSRRLSWRLSFWMLTR